MNQNQYLEKFAALQRKKLLITKAKNSDYAHAEDAFANFTLIEKLTNGKISTGEGMLIRLTDKLQRVANLLYKPASVADEKLEVTLLDLSNYADIMNIYFSTGKDARKV